MTQLENKGHVRDEDDVRSLTRHVHDETGPNCGLGLLEVDFPAVERPAATATSTPAQPSECGCLKTRVVWRFRRVEVQAAFKFSRQCRRDLGGTTNKSGVRHILSQLL